MHVTRVITNTMLAAGLAFSASPVLAADNATADGTTALIANHHECPYSKDKECPDWLNLTDDQLVKLNELKTNYISNSAAKKAQVRVLRRQLGVLMTADQQDKDKINDLHKQLTGLRTELSQARLNFLMDSFAALDADQRKDLRRKLLKHMLCGMGRHGRYCPRGSQWGAKCNADTGSDKIAVDSEQLAAAFEDAMLSGAL